MGDRLQQIQISMAWSFRLAFGLDGLQHQPGGCAGEPLGETGPELFGPGSIALQGADRFECFA